MSYCRFGEDSDLYIYKSIQSGDIVVHVGYRETGEHHPLQGEVYQFSGRGDALDFVNTLKNDGYKVPDRAIERLKD